MRSKPIEFSDRALAELVPPVEPTEEEKRNGWTIETLTEYRRQAFSDEQRRINPAFRARRPMRANSRYNPFKWREL